MKKIWFIGMIIGIMPVCAFAQDGALDSTFGLNGSVIFPKLFNQDQQITSILDSEGRILIASTTYHDSILELYRYLPDGAPDENFGASGQVVFTAGTNGFPEGEYSLGPLRIQPDQKILVGLYLTETNAGPFVLLRLTEDGRLDPAFGQEGLSPIDLDTSFYFSSLCLQTDRKMLLSGSIGKGSLAGNGNTDVILLRLLESGEIDTTFGDMGMVVTDLTDAPFNVDVGGPLLVQADGKIVVAGTNGTGLNTSGYFALMRHEPNGPLDTTFGVRGIYIDSIRSFHNSESFAITLSETSSIIIAGLDGETFGGGPYSTLRQYTNEGFPDPFFADNGWYISNIEGNIGGFQDVIVQPDQKILASGFKSHVTGGISVLTRFNSNGVHDPDFGFLGSVHFQYNLQPTWGSSVYLYPERKISLLGYTDTNPDYLRQVFLARFNHDLHSPVKDDLRKGDLSITPCPNPCDDEALRLTYNLPASGKISTRLFDAFGNVIALLSDEEDRPVGLQNDIITLPKGLVPGIYIIRVSTQTGTGGSSRLVRL